MPYDMACGWLDHLTEWPPDYYVNTMLISSLCMLVSGLAGKETQLHDFAVWRKAKRDETLTPAEQYAKAVAAATRAKYAETDNSGR